MKPLPKKYKANETEKKWQDHWLGSGVYEWESDQPRDNTFVIDTPPPTVSGTLHMGHIFSYVQAEYVARFQRMFGKTVFYPIGFDDNGLPTERLVEKKKKIRAIDMSREDFIETCMGVSKDARAEFKALFQSVGMSFDWTQEYHTISEHARRISQMSFLDLYEKKEAYRKLQPMLWDPVDQTAIAQAEVEEKEKASSFNDITFKVDGSDETFVIGTTRPEMLPACVAIFYHPDDERYQHLKGKQAVTPLFGQKVPIMEDDTVEPEKGTGIMMCCTFGDEADIEKWKKHDLPLKVILNKFGKLEGIEGEHAEALNGLKAEKAREKALELLEASGDLVESKPINHMVKCAERSGAALEIIPTPQWFVKVLEHKEALKAKSKACNWNPEWMQKRMEQWIDGLSWDWCISRQRYFGVPFPVWYAHRIWPKDNDGRKELGNNSYSISTKMILAGPHELPINPISTLPDSVRETTAEELEKLQFEHGVGFDSHSKSGKYVVVLKDIYLPNETHAQFKQGEYLYIKPDLDVMDTWATSACSPQISSGALTEDYAVDWERHQKLYPADLRPQAHEIIRTWAFYTLVKSHLHSDDKPWNDLMVSGWCLASDKTKMSKSKGNIVDPINLLATHGADAVRYWASTSKLGTDTAYSEETIKVGKKLVTKLWNASKFAALNLDKLEQDPTTPREDVASGIITESLDQWILTRLSHSIKKSQEAFAEYEFSVARQAAEDFFWNDFCDNYLELCKVRAYGEKWEGRGQQSALTTLYHCLNGILKLFAPFVPHITEELYSHIFDEEYEREGSIHRRDSWPKLEDQWQDETAEAKGKATVEVLGAIRKLKAEKGVSIKMPLEEVAVQGAEVIADDALLLDDLRETGSVITFSFAGKDLPEKVTSENGAYTLTAKFADQEDAA